MLLSGEILSPDGQTSFSAEMEGTATKAEALGIELGEKLLAKAGADFLARLKSGA
jgi:hydroxymethylbilane synthase